MRLFRYAALFAVTLLLLSVVDVRCYTFIADMPCFTCCHDIIMLYCCDVVITPLRASAEILALLIDDAMRYASRYALFAAILRFLCHYAPAISRMPLCSIPFAARRYYATRYLYEIDCRHNSRLRHVIDDTPPLLLPCYTLAADFRRFRVPAFRCFIAYFHC